MRPKHRIAFLCGLAATVPGWPAGAGEERRMAEEPGEVRVDAAALRNLLRPARQVTVVGTARASVVPDLAEIALGVSTSRPTALEAVEANNLAMSRLIEALKGRGVAPNDIQTSQLSISPQYAQQVPGVPGEVTAPRLVGYEVSNVVRVTTKDLAKVGGLVDAAVKAGSNQMHGISFRVKDRESVMEGLRADAFDAARKKSELYAKRSGLALGAVLQITEADPAGMPAPQPPMMYRMAAADAQSMPVSPGEQEVSLSVTVSFELNTRN